MFKPTAKVLADSISEAGDRLTTMEVTGHRFILAEFNTHRAFSRNSASSRAIPYHRMREKALSRTAYPVSWPTEQKGMQGGAEIEDDLRARFIWEEAAITAVEHADRLVGLGIHKSVVNRLLEPFLPHTIIVSATDWQGFWAQRCHADAQPEIRELACAMRDAYIHSQPKIATYGSWHLPLVDEDDLHMTRGMEWMDRIELLKKLSVARCARVSYLTHDGTRDHEKDLELYDRLFSHKPAHASPFEHVATPVVNAGLHPMYASRGNFKGWHQLRHLLDLG